MAETPSARFTVQRFSGLNTNDNPHLVPASGAVECDNISYNTAGEIRCRNGMRPVYPENAISATGGQSIMAFSYLQSQANFLVYEDSAGSLHISRNPT